MKKLSKLVSLMLSVVLCIGMASPAFAATYYLEDGSVTVSNRDGGTWVDQGKTSQADNEITITQRNSGTATQNTITVGEGVKDTTITLENVNIDVSTAGKAALSVTGTGEANDETHVTINLVGTNTLKSGSSHAGLELNEGASVTIQAEEPSEEGKPNSLTATGGIFAAGIGGKCNGTAGDIEISGNANVIATGGIYAAGIGSGGYNWSSYNQAAGNITIKDDANVVARGGESGAGIGTGYYGKLVDTDSSDSTKAGKIAIEGNAKVTATGGKFAAGIGNGQKGEVGDIEISLSGGTVTAEGGDWAAGIGNGYGKCSAGNITIGGEGSITAKKGQYACGDIGKGYDYYSPIGTVNVQILQNDGTLFCKRGSDDYSPKYTFSPPDKDTKITLNEDGSVNLPAGTRTNPGNDDSYLVYPEGTTLDKDGNASPNSPYVKKSGSHSVTIYDGKGTTTAIDKSSWTDYVSIRNTKDNVSATTKVCFPKNQQGEIKVDENYNVTVEIPVGMLKTGGDISTVYPNGVTLDQYGNLLGDNNASITKNEDGSVTFNDGQGSTIIASAPEGEESAVKIEVADDGTVTVNVPAGTVVTGTDGSKTALCTDGTIDASGKSEPGTHEYTGTSTATCMKDGVATYTCSKCKHSYTVTAEKLDHTPGAAAPENVIEAQPGVEGSYDLVVRCTVCGEIISSDHVTTSALPVPAIPDDGADAADAAPATATIADQEVPLAGLVSRQILVSALYVQAGSPDGEDAEGEYTKALAWAVANGIIDAESDPEEVVTVAILRDIMTRYAKFLDVIFDVEIPGEDDEIVMNCDEILEEFFASQEDKAA